MTTALLVELVEVVVPRSREVEMGDAPLFCEKSGAAASKMAARRIVFFIKGWFSVFYLIREVLFQ